MFKLFIIILTVTLYVHILYTHLNIYEQLLLETCSWRPSGLVLISRFWVVDLTVMVIRR